MFETHRQIIMAWPHLSDFAADIGVSENTAKGMRQRNSIPADYWPSVVHGARKRKIVGVTTDLLVALRNEARMQRRVQSVHAA
jgi:hypothetical protein